MDQILAKDPTEIYYMERIVFRKDVNRNNNWTFDKVIVENQHQLL